MAKSYFEQKCRICGCDWNHACNDHDYWYAEDLCSACAEAMKPILFNTPMVQAVLEGRKTHTRRVIKPPAEVHNCTDGIFVTRPIKAGGEYCRFDPYEPYQPGDILYVRETWCERLGDISRGKYIYRAQAEPQDEIHQYALDQNRWRPSIHMPKVAARIFLRVVGVRPERLQDITEDGEKAEGMVYTDFGTYKPKWKASIDGGKTFHPAKEALYFGWHSGTVKRPEDCFPTPRGAFAHLWDSTLKKTDLGRFGWAANPWVWNIEFERIGRETEKTT